MKKLITNPLRALVSTVCILVLPALFASCEGLQEPVKTEDLNTSHAAAPSYTPAAFPASGNLVEVRTEHMNILMPDEIPSGWNTFRYQNKSHMTHLIAMDKMPVYEGRQITIEDFMQNVVVFQDAMDLINAGQAEEGYAEFARLAPWSGQVVYTGGVGLVSAGQTAQTTVYLEPGLYIAECYVKTGGKFHPMYKQFVVTEESTDARPPKADLNIHISAEGGIEADAVSRPGLHTVAVHFKDQAVHENFLGHDVNLVKLEENTDLEALARWVNWADPQGLETPAPASFLGGTQQMNAGNTTYFTINLKPGRYAWIAEVPNPASKGMLKTFTIPAGKDADKRAAK